MSDYYSHLSDCVYRAREALETKNPVSTGIILGTGWDKSFNMVNKKSESVCNIMGCNLQKIEGHDRVLECGSINGKKIIVLRGRIHLYESFMSPSIPMLVRMQTELLMKLGVKRLIVTASVGGLRMPEMAVGNIAIINNFITLFAPNMPLWGNEFLSLEDVFDVNLNVVAMNAAHKAGLRSQIGAHVMVRGPHFESNRDKETLRCAGGDVVGMSMLPEAYIVSLYKQKMIGLGFVSNGRFERYSHKKNLMRGKENSKKLGQCLQNIIGSVA